MNDWRLSIALFFSLCLAPRAFAGDARASLDERGLYCGIYSTCRALELLGKQVNPKEYATKDYVGHPFGSSSDDLVRICEMNGAQADCLKGLSKIDVYSLGCPIIANVRKNEVSSEFDHWVCVFVEAQKLYVYDGTSLAHEISFGDFASVWNGVGIVVSMEGGVGWQLALTRACILIGLGWTGWCLARLGGSVKNGLQFAMFSLFAIALTSSAGTVLFGDISSHTRAIRTSCEPFDSTEVEEAALDDLRSPPRGTLIVDARYAIDFERGAVPGAVNLPVSSTRILLRDRLSDVQLDTPIIVYCQSAPCPFDGIMARRLKALGFTNIRACDSGWFEFTEDTEK